MTQQLSLFDLGEPVKPEPKKKSGSKTAKAKNTSSENSNAEAISDVALPQEKTAEPMEFFFFVADDIVADKKETIEEAVTFTNETVDINAEEEVFEEEIIVFTEEENNNDTPEKTDASIPEGQTVYEPDEKITIVRKRGRKSFKEIDAEVDLISVPDDEELFKKQYYSITEVAKWFRVNNSLLRFWENEFPILKPRKNKKGDRLFRPEDVKNLQVIYYLLRQRKFTIDGARKYMKAHKENIEVNLKLIQSLNKFKGFLLELKANTEK